MNYGTEKTVFHTAIKKTTVEDYILHHAHCHMNLSILSLSTIQRFKYIYQTCDLNETFNVGVKHFTYS